MEDELDVTSGSGVGLGRGKDTVSAAKGAAVVVAGEEVMSVKGVDDC